MRILRFSIVIYFILILNSCFSGIKKNIDNNIDGKTDRPTATTTAMGDANKDNNSITINHYAIETTAKR